MAGETTLKLMDNPLVRVTAEGKMLDSSLIRSVQLFGAELLVTPSSDLSTVESNTLVMGSVGMTIEDIAATLWESPDTVKSRRRVIARKLGAVNLVHTTTMAFEQGIYKTLTPASAPNPSLTKRQLELLEVRAAGISVSQIAQALSIDARTVKTHQMKTAEKVGLREATQQVLFGYLSGLLAPRISAEILTQYNPAEDLPYAVNK